MEGAVGMQTTSNQKKHVKDAVVSCVNFSSSSETMLDSLVVSMLSVPSPAGCPYEGMRYYDIDNYECAPCTGTCEEPNPICPLVCRSGCGCPPGTVLHEGECVDETECPRGESCDYHMTAGNCIDISQVILIVLHMLTECFR